MALWLTLPFARKHGRPTRILAASLGKASLGKVLQFSKPKHRKA
jgi:hypothetical protein